MHNTTQLRRVLLALACSASLSVMAQTAPAQRIDVPPGDLAQALETLRKQTGGQLMYRGDQMEGVRTKGVRGTLTADEALQRLLEGSGFEVVKDPSGAVLIKKNERVSEPKERAITPPVTGSVFPITDSEVKELERIVVTGTNLRGIAPESSPVITYTREEIDATGLTSVDQFLRTVPQNLPAGITQETFRDPASGGDSQSQGAGVNLRGLGQRATLVLLNGRRLAPSFLGGYVDVSLIPLSAVDRIDILTDGASAVYGSDAVGGVINFILRDDFDGLETGLTVGSSTRGDGDQIRTSATGGLVWNGGHGLLSYEFRRQDRILVGDRRDIVAGTPDSSYFLLEEMRHSVIGAFQQQLTDDIFIDVNGTYSTRKTRRDWISSSSPLLIRAPAEAESWTISGVIGRAIGSTWQGRLEGSVARSHDIQTTSRPDGALIVFPTDFRNSIESAALRFDGDLVTLPAGPVKLAFGSEVRRERLILPAVTRNRLVKSVYVESQVPIISPGNAVHGIERLELNAAARYDHHDQFGNAINPKIGILWSPSENTSLRASYGTSFRAPLLNESAKLYSYFYFPAESVYLTSPAPDGAAMVLLGSNPALDSETSRTWTIGLDYRRPQPFGVVASLTYFQTVFSDRIGDPSPSSRIVGNPAFDPIITRNPSLLVVESLAADAGPGSADFSGIPGGAQFADVVVIVDNRVTNSAKTSTKGIDANLEFRFPVGRGRMTFSTNIQYVLEFDNQLTVAAPVTSTLDTTFSQTKLRSRSSVAWADDNFAGSLFLNHTDDYRDTRFVPPVPVDSFTTFDLTASFRMPDAVPSLLRGMRFSAGIINVTDERPPRINLVPGVLSGNLFDPVNATGTGRSFTISLSKVW